jgi:hypothetical protein
METLHFRVGADLGITLMQISQEHLLYNADPVKALSVFSDSFGGECPMDLQLALLRGDKVVAVDVEDQMFNIVSREDHHDAIYPAKIDFEKFFADKQEQMDDHCNDFTEGVNYIMSELRNMSRYQINFSVDSVIQYISGNDEMMMEELREDAELNQYTAIVKFAKQFIEKSIKLEQLSKTIQGYYPELKIEFDGYEVWMLATKIQNLVSMKLWAMQTDDSVTNYIDAVQEMNDALEGGIEPVDIMDNYSAGWLSPDGDFYGLNGEIANMLHTNIADALQEAGIIPDEDALGFDSPDAWLEQNGWCRIHGNNVQFAGNLNEKIDKENVHMTDDQRKITAEYIDNCHQCKILLGWKRTPYSVGMYRAMDKIALHKHFEF